MSLDHFIWGTVATVLGVLSLKFNFQLVGITGSQDWIESKLGGGTTYFVFKLLSLMLIIFGILYAIGLAGNVFFWLLSPLRGIFTNAKT